IKESLKDFKSSRQLDDTQVCKGGMRWQSHIGMRNGFRNSEREQ
ncbi:unnamed protein product, partial [marine sediment metagenome]